MGRASSLLASTFQVGSMRSTAMIRVLIEKDRRDAGLASQWNQSALGLYPIRVWWDRRRADPQKRIPNPIHFPRGQLWPHSASRGSSMQRGSTCKIQKLHIFCQPNSRPHRPERHPPMSRKPAMRRSSAQNQLFYLQIMIPSPHPDQQCAPGSN